MWDTPGSATACGFFFPRPRLNAGGRIAHADLGLKLLLSQDVNEARTLATELDDINAGARDVESAILTAAEAQAGDRSQQARASFLSMTHHGSRYCRDRGWAAQGAL